MPQLGETVTEGTILTWLKQPGEAVEVDDGLFEVSTEKVDTEIPSAVAGVLRVQLVDEGETVPIGTPVAVITATVDDPLDLAELAGTPVRHSVAADSVRGRTDEGRGGVEESTESVLVGPGPVGMPSSEPSTSSSGSDSAAVGTDSAQNLRQRPETDDSGEAGVGQVISPVVRRMLSEHGLTAEEVVGTGRAGRITRADVVATAAATRGIGRAPTSGVPPDGEGDGGGATRPVPPGPSIEGRAPGSVRAPVIVGERDEVIDFSRSREATAAHMVESLSTAAHALVALTVDYAAIDAVRRRSGLSYLPFVARAVIEAISEFPHLNSSVIDDEQGRRLVVHRDVNLGVAVDVDREALMVPVVHGADQMRIGALADAMADLAEQARRRRLAGEALSGGTFTITNVGAYGTLVTSPIINQPQVAILSTDGVRMTPVAVPVDDDAWGIAVHPVGNLCLSFDHRAFDGAYAAAFLARVRSELEGRDWEAEVVP